MKTILVLIGVLLAPFAWGFNFTTSCTNACGHAVLVAGETATCRVTVANDTEYDQHDLMVDSIYYGIFHGNSFYGTGTQGFAYASGTPTVLPAGTRGVFPAAIPWQRGDPGLLRVMAEGEFRVTYPYEYPYYDSANDALQVVASDPCIVPSSTTTTTTVPAIPPTTVTTVPCPTPTTTIPSCAEALSALLTACH